MHETAAIGREHLAGLHEMLAAFAEMGATSEGGVTRLAASAEDGQARDALCAWLRRHEFEIAIDRVGNLFGYLDLGDASRAGAVYCGSHLDSQPNGGRFDGTYGVVAACCAALAVRERVNSGELQSRYRYLVVVSWTNEEGARYQPSLLGSSVFSGALDAGRALEARDAKGVSLAEALSDIGYLGHDSPPADPDWYVELHVEQGSVLERQRRRVGIVSRCWGARKFTLQFVGRADHTGPTPMTERRDALRAASLLIAGVTERALASDGRLHGSVGRILVEPNSPNVVPQSATLFVELRSGEESELDAAEVWLKETLERICRTTGCRGVIDGATRRAVEAFDPDGVAIAGEVVESCGLDGMAMATIAGHDALALQRRYPAILLFVPSAGGISHSPAEFTTKQDLETGLQVLVAVLCRLLAEPSGRPGSRGRGDSP